MKHVLLVVLIVASGCTEETPLHEGKSVAEWRQQLRDADSPTRQLALRALGRAGATDAAPEVAVLLKDSDPVVRALASSTLWTMGPDAAVAVPELTAAMKDPVVNVRVCAVGALGGFGAAAKDVVPQIADLLEDEDPLVRHGAALALKAIG